MKKRIIFFAIFGTRLEMAKYLSNTLFWDMMFNVIEICLPFEVPSLCIQGKQFVKVVLDYIASHLRGTYPTFTTIKPQISQPNNSSRLI